MIFTERTVTIPSLQKGTVTTMNLGADIEVKEVNFCRGESDVVINIHNMHFEADDLREAADLFIEMAEVLEKNN